MKSTWGWAWREALMRRGLGRRTWAFPAGPRLGGEPTRLFAMSWFGSCLIHGLASLFSGSFDSGFPEDLASASRGRYCWATQELMEAGATLLLHGYPFDHG